MLFLSELESGTRVVSLGSVAVRPELEAVGAELEERASRAGVALAVEGDPAIELAIRPRMMRVVAQNLAENAIRYAGPGATFTLAVEHEDGAIVLRGTDDGVGVDEAELTRLFERFFRADRARASRGTGLGLAIVKHIVTQAGGTVEARGGLGRRARDPLRVSCLSRFFSSSSPDVHHLAAVRPRHSRCASDRWSGASETADGAGGAARHAARRGHARRAGDRRPRASRRSRTARRATSSSGARRSSRSRT